MLEIRKAKISDQPAILQILEELDLASPLQKTEYFWVAEVDNEIAGIARLEDCGEYLFLSCVGVKTKHHNQGIASRLLEPLLINTKHKIYLYTTIPEFFKRFGFKNVSPSSRLPSKEYFSCQECFPEKCQVMVKLPDAS
jgi:N-acetylglutamate synthase-like GNAT family acetyltransferase